MEDLLTSLFTPDAASALDGPGWLRTRRAAAAERFAALELPTEAEEIWRYSRIADLDLDAYRLVDQLQDDNPGVLRQAVVAHVGEVSAVVSVVNGKIDTVRLADAAPPGLFVGQLSDVADGDDVLGAIAPSATDAFTELNTAFLADAVLVRVPDGVTVEHPVLVMHRIDREGVAAFPRTIVQAGPDSEVTVIEHQASHDIAAFVDPVVELDVADAARVRYVNVQDWGPRVWQVGYQASRVARDATLRSSVVALGGDYARVRNDSSITGRGGSSYLTAVYFADGNRMHDFRTLQDHQGPSSTSDLLFKGAVQDRGHSVYSGLIRVEKQARGTNAFQTNRNIVLSQGADAKSVPNLEIETDDVRCSHASAVGPIDEEQLYYLESRGVPPAVAQRLIVLGFFSEVLDRLPEPALVERIRASVAERITGQAP